MFIIIQFKEKTDIIKAKSMKQKFKFFIGYCFFLIGLSTACLAFNQPNVVQEMITLTPWVWNTPTPAPTKVIPMPTITDQPFPFQTYTVKEGDTLSDIAFRFHLTIEDLLLANAGLDERLIPKGATLIIPQKQEGKIILPTPTPIFVEILPSRCYAALPSGQYCLSLVHNSSPDPIDDISAAVSLFQEDGKRIAEQRVALPLTRLAAGKSLPLLAHFPTIAFPHSQASVQLLSALPAHNGDGRFLPLIIQIEQNNVVEDGKAVQLSGKIVVDLQGTPSHVYVRMAAVAYESSRQPVGLRAWDWKGDVQPNQELPFKITVFSLSGAIADVDIQAEASKQ